MDKGKAKMAEYEDDRFDDDASLDSELGGFDVSIGAKKALISANEKLRRSTREKNPVSRFGYNDYMAYHYAFMMKVAYQHFFVQESSSHPVILGEPYITAARMETKVLNNGSAYARVKSQDGRHSVQFLTVRPGRAPFGPVSNGNRDSLGSENREDF